MTNEKYDLINKRLAALERLILAPARRGKGGRQQQLLKHNKRNKPPRRNRLDSL